MSDWDWDFLKTVVFAILIFVLLTGGMIWGANTYNHAACEAITVDIGFDHRYSFLGGCQIEVNEGQWIPLDSYYFKEE
ncbi:MAG TPA: hypothetical protein DDY71_11170 [Spirochaetia bacterium]|nr:hypothetical protein [Spirochaetia bacterium]